MRFTIIAVAVLLAGCDQNPQPRAPRSSAKDPPQIIINNSPAPATFEANQLPETKKISWSQYEMVADGMSYDDIIKIFSQTGKLDASQEIDGQIIKTYSFGDYSQGAIVMISQGKVISKMPGLLQAE